MKEFNMKMNYFTLFFVALFFQSCTIETIENDWTEENLKGKVKSYSEFTYEAEERFGKIEKGERDFCFFLKKSYDEKGNKIEENRYYSDGRCRYKYTYKYDEKGNIIEKNTYNSDGRLEYKYTYKYDEKGNKIEENSYDSDGRLDPKWTYKYEFDKQGNWINRIGFENAIPTLISEREYEYY